MSTEDTGEMLAEARKLFDTAGVPVRAARWHGLPIAGEYLLDALHDDALLTSVGELLGQATPLTEFGGRDKTLKFWTREDWDAARLARHLDAENATAAAEDFDLLVASRFIAAMDRAGVHQTGELFPSLPTTA